MPVDQQDIIADETYFVTYDNRHFSPNATMTLEVKFLPNGSADSSSSVASDFPLAWETQVPSAVYNISVEFSADWLQGHNSSNLTLFLHENGSDDQPYPGPFLTLISANSTDDHNKTSSRKGGDKKVGEKVGIPIGTIFFFAVILGLAYYFRRQILAKCSSVLGGKGGGKGYTGSEARRNTGLGNDAFAMGHQRGDSFHDEPMRGGVELQDRAGGPGGPNMFRDELDRQRDSRR